MDFFQIEQESGGVFFLSGFNENFGIADDLVERSAEGVAEVGEALMLVG